jgi:hypothetical protein
MDYAVIMLRAERARLSRQSDEILARIDELDHAINSLGGVEETDALKTRSQRRPYTIEETLEIVRLRDELNLQWSEIGLIVDRNPSSASGQYWRYKNNQI